MISKGAVILTILPLLAISAPARPASPPFTLQAIHSTSIVHLQPINAAHHGFVISEPPNTYCPLEEIGRCHDASQTAVIVDNGGATLDIEGPGPQSLYVAEHGALSFDTASLPNTIPAGAATNTFRYRRPIIPSEPGDLLFHGLGSHGWLACPSNAADGVPYTVYANVTGLSNADVPGGNVDACIGIAIATTPYTGPLPWEYQ